MSLVRNMAEGWEAEHAQSGVSCVRDLATTAAQPIATSTGPCHLLSPDTESQDHHITPLSHLTSQGGHQLANASEALGSVLSAGLPGQETCITAWAVLFRVPRVGDIAFDDDWVDAVRQPEQKSARRGIHRGTRATRWSRRIRLASGSSSVGTSSFDGSGQLMLFIRSVPHGDDGRPYYSP